MYIIYIYVSIRKGGSGTVTGQVMVKRKKTKQDSLPQVLTEQLL